MLQRHGAQTMKDRYRKQRPGGPFRLRTSIMTTRWLMPMEWVVAQGAASEAPARAPPRGPGAKVTLKSLHAGGSVQTGYHPLVYGRISRSPDWRHPTFMRSLANGSKWAGRASGACLRI